MIKKSFRVSLALATGMALLAGGAAAPTQAKTKTVTACVKKKTGEVRVIKPKKKCKKGWKKVSWNQQGGPGATGPDGPNLLVKDGNGNVLGRSLGTFSEGISLFTVEIDGGAFTYLPNGLLYPMTGSPNFKTNTCTGTAHVRLDNLGGMIFAGAANGLSRFVYRQTDPTLGPASAWAFTPSTEVVAGLQLYELDSTGACVADGAAYSGTLGTLTSVAAPRDVPGPLSVG